MILERLELTHIRNIRRADISFSPSFNILVGPNGAGKTALLESVHLLVRARSFRAGNLNSLITHGTDELLVRAQGQSNDVAITLALQKKRHEPVRLRYNQADVRQVSTMAARVPIQVLLPNLADLVFGAPAIRRHWLDWGVFHHDNEYVSIFNEFRRCLRQRNAALRHGERSAISVWTHRFAICADSIARKRESYLEAIRTPFSEALRELAPELNVTLELQPGWDLENTEEKLDKLYERELQYGYSQHGPHRADLRLRLQDMSGSQSSRDAARVLSRGQGKCVASAMKLAQVALLQQKGLETVFLLDDVAAELDLEHAHRFLRLLRATSAQMVATTVRGSAFSHSWRDSMDADDQLFNVDRGVIKGAKT